jgi:hypothetical protein
MKKLEDVIASKRARIIIVCLGALIVAFLIFHAGVELGEHRSQFGHRDADRDFRHPFFPPGFALPHEFTPDGHGAVGTVTTVALPSFTMQTRDGISQAILVSSTTIIRNMGSPNNQNVSVGDNVVVLGDPDAQNRINAKFIRIIPAPPPFPLP